jgi:hypothetical protein
MERTRTKHYYHKDPEFTEFGDGFERRLGFGWFFESASRVPSRPTFRLSELRELCVFGVPSSSPCPAVSRRVRAIILRELRLFVMI